MFNIHARAIRHGRRVLTAWVAAAAACLTGCATTSPDYQNQRAFTRAEDAATALIAAATVNDVASLETIFGPEGQAVLSSGDPIADRNNREVFAIAASERWSLERIDNSTRELVIGHEEWPFPVPLVKDSHGWWFNTVAGKWEVLARRIGRNELATIGTLRMYVAAQLQYAREGRDGKPAGIYAQRVRSEPGKNNGLFWPRQSTTDPASPLGDFATVAFAEGYGTKGEGMEPYHGYFYRILTRQGGDAAGGARDYITSGDMTGGFAMLAYPANYGSSGVMSFLVGPDGIVYESDLGSDTSAIAGSIQEYNPGAGWVAVD